MTKLLTILVAAGALLANGCGDTSNAAADNAAKREQAMLKFAQCMRSHGVDVPDPTTDSNGNLAIRGPGRVSGAARPADDSKERTAERACRKHLAGIAQSFTPQQRAEMQDRMVRFAECMRDKGIDMPDPDFSEGGVGFRQRIRAGGVNPQDEKFQTASQECSKQVFGGQAGRGGPGRGMFFAPPPDAKG